MGFTSVLLLQRGISMLDGFWTYIIPTTIRGGILCIKSGMVTGGDNIAFFNGVAIETESELKITVLTTRFNDAAQLDGLWGETQRRYAMEFIGRRDGDNISGKFRRPDLVNSTFEIVATRRGPAP
jgi:hypothetical protein